MQSGELRRGEKRIGNSRQKIMRIREIIGAKKQRV
jgi:hypothetical protein